MSKHCYNAKAKQYLITRRTTDGAWWFDPDNAETRGIFLYVLARAIQLYGVGPVSLVVMANHIHLMAHDYSGDLTDFRRYVFSQTARAMNRLLGRSGAFWEPDRGSAVECTTRESVIDKTAYTLLNPVGGNVHSPEDYEGFVTTVKTLGSKVLVPRPDVYFSKKRPKVLELNFETPPGWKPEDWRDAVDRAVKAGTAKALKERPTKAPFVLNHVPAPMPQSFSPRYAGNRKSIEAAKDAWATLDRKSQRRARILSFIADILLPEEEVGIRHLLRLRGQRE